MAPHPDLRPDLRVEQELFDAGAAAVLGLDEAGRGSWAGPLSVGAVILTPGVTLDEVADSKLLSARRRSELCRIVEERVPAACGFVSAADIDRIGISAALTVAVSRAVAELTARGCTFDAVIVDGPFDFARLGVETRTVVKGDRHCQPVAAASIVAKVHRDRHMAELDTAHPGYGLAAHKGYMTAAHRDAVAELGLSVEHRTSWHVPPHAAR